MGNNKTTIFDEGFTNLFSLTKTLRFELKPTPETKSLVDVIKEDKDINRLYREEMKPMFDKLHEDFITEAMQSTELPLDLLESLEKSFLKLKELKKDKKINRKIIDKLENSKDGEIEKLQEQLRRELVKAFNNLGDNWKTIYSSLKLKGVGFKILTEAKILEVLLKRNPDKEASIKKFSKFFTYFSGFNQNRENYYTSEEKATSVANRTINENFSRFLDDKQKFEELILVMPQLSTFVDKFKLENYKDYLTQEGIDKFNQDIIGKINKESNLFSQQNRGALPKAPKFKILYKQIGCGKKESFIFDIKENEEWGSLQTLISEQYKKVQVDNKDILLLEYLKELYLHFFSAPDLYDLDKIYFNKSSINIISSLWFVNWHKLSELLALSKIIKNKNKESGEYTIPEKISLTDLREVLETERNVGDLFRCGKIDDSEGKKDNPVGVYEKLFAHDGWKTFLAIWQFEINSNFRLLADKIKAFDELKIKTFSKKEHTQFIKEICDAFLSIERMVKFHRVKEAHEKDDSFYSIIDLYLQETTLNKYYDAFRNYLTKKPFDENKVKLNFKSGDLLGGWSKTFETYGALLFENGGKYYLGIINGTKFSETELASLYSKIDIKNKATRLLYNTQKIDNKNPPRWFIRSKKTAFSPMVREGLIDPVNILDLYDRKLYSKTENKDGYREYLPRLVDYFKEGFLKHKDFVSFSDSFLWLDSKEYDTIVDFYNHTADMCYKTSWEDINFEALRTLSQDGRIFLFEVCNKDFRSQSTGLKNLHTLLFLELLKPENNIKFKLLGGGEIFYREKSIVREIDKDRSFKTDNFEIIKNRRYSEEKYLLHFPIEIKGRKLKGSFNAFLNQKIKKDVKNVAILGIDRGEKHLLYWSLTDGIGRMISQGSFNKIKTKSLVDEKKMFYRYANKSGWIDIWKGFDNKILGKLEDIKLENTGKRVDYVDYHLLLDYYEKKRILARQSWETIGKIKDLKEGYLSQVVHEIYQLVIEHKAIIVLEDLNSEFKAKRTSKVEKSVYKKFELALARKLNHLILKDKEANEVGGVLNAYQLTPAIPAGKIGEFEKSKQWGIMFYVRPDYTSSTDPVSGWRKTIYISNSESIPVIKKKWKEFGISINFDKEKDCFKFSYDKWQLYAHKDLSRLYWNRNEKNEVGGFGRVKSYNLKQEFETLFSGLDKTKNINQQIESNEKFNWKQLVFCWNLLNQIRNSDKNETDDRSDFIQSPVWSEKIQGFYDSRESSLYESKYHLLLPNNGDSNGAYNIARKGVILVNRIVQNSEKFETFISNEQWDDAARDWDSVMKQE
jgi:hypothetical protein